MRQGLGLGITYRLIVEINKQIKNYVRLVLGKEARGLSQLPVSMHGVALRGKIARVAIAVVVGVGQGST